MTQVTRDLIFRVGVTSTGDEGKNLAVNLQKVSSELKQTTANTMGFVEAEKKMATASAAAGASFERTSKNVSSFDAKMAQARKSMTGLTAMEKIGKLVEEAMSEMLSGTEKMAEAAAELKTKIDGLDTIEEKTAALREFADTLPDNLKVPFLDVLEEGLTTVDEKVVTAVGQLRKMKAQLASMEEGTPEFEKLRAEAAALEDKIGDVRAGIANLASDTKGIDTLVSIGEGAVGAFTAFEGAMALAGAEGEDYQKTLAKVQGAMALLQGTQAVFKTLLEESTARTVVATNWQKLYAAAVGNSTGAMKFFRQAGLALGIGVLIAGLGYLIANWSKLSQAIGLSNPIMERNTAIMNKAIESVADERAELLVATAALKDQNTSQERRKKLIDDLKAKYPSYLKNIDSEKSGYNEIAHALENVNQALLTKARAEAAQEMLSEKLKEQLTLQQQLLNDSSGVFSKIGSGLGEAFGGSTVTDRLDKLHFEIEDLVNFIAAETQSLEDQGGDPVAPIEKAVDTKEKEVKVKLGTIAELEKKVSDLRKKVTEDIRLDADDFMQTVAELNRAEQQLKDAQDRLQVQVDTAPEDGSIAALEARVAALKFAVDNTSQSAEGYTEILKQMFEAEDILQQARKMTERPATSQTDLFTLLEADLTEAERHQLQMANIEELGQQKILQIQIDYLRRRLELYKDNGKLTEQEERNINNRIAELEAEKLKASKDASEKRSEEDQKRIQKIIDSTIALVNASLQAANTIVDIERKKVEALISLQQRRVDEVAKIADQGNAELLQAEEKRLNDLNKKREKFVRQQQALAAIQMVAETSVAVAKAAAEGGGIGSAITIATLLISLAAGLAQAKAMSQQAAFYDGGEADWSKLGGYTGDGNPRATSLAQGRKPYTYHRREYIMDHTVTGIGRNREWFDFIRKYRVDLSDVFGQRNQSVVAINNNDEVVRAIREIKPTNVHVSASSKGIFNVVTRETNRLSKHKNRRRLR